MSATTLRIDAQNQVALLTIDRPHKHNALDYATIDRLMEVLDEIEVDSAVRAVILTSAGHAAFSAGADITGFAASLRAGTQAALRQFVRRGQRLTAKLESFPKPVIAAVNGMALGAGCEIVEAVPLAIASERASFAKPEIKLGFPPPFGGTQRLPRLIGRKRAMHMILTAEPISAATAVEIGLVNKVVPHDRLLEEAHQLAATVIAKPALAVSACLASVTRGLNVAIGEGLEIEASCFAQTVPTRDLLEGVTAFIEKRPAQFVGT